LTAPPDRNVTPLRRDLAISANGGLPKDGKSMSQATKPERTGVMADKGLANSTRPIADQNEVAAFQIGRAHV
jgi:hypothetical protein